MICRRITKKKRLDRGETIKPPLRGLTPRKLAARANAHFRRERSYQLSGVGVGIAEIGVIAVSDVDKVAQFEH